MKKPIKIFIPPWLDDSYARIEVFTRKTRDMTAEGWEEAAIVYDVKEKEQRITQLESALRDMSEALRLIALDNIYIAENGWRDEYFLSVNQANEALSRNKEILDTINKRGEE